MGNGHEPDRRARGRAGHVLALSQHVERSDHQQSRRAISQALRSGGAGPAGGVSVLRLHRKPGVSASGSTLRHDRWLRSHVRRSRRARCKCRARSFAVLRATSSEGDGGSASRTVIRASKPNLLPRALRTSGVAIEEPSAELVGISPGRPALKLSRRAAWIQNARERSASAPNRGTNCRLTRLLAAT